MILALATASLTIIAGGAYALYTTFRIETLNKKLDTVLDEVERKLPDA